MNIIYAAITLVSCLFSMVIIVALGVHRLSKISDSFSTVLACISPSSTVNLPSRDEVSA